MANPDLILHNGRIYPHPDGTSRAEAIAIWNGRVSNVGPDRQILQLKASSVKTVDLHQKVVIPGLIDSHVHLLWYGLFLRTLNLKAKRSIVEIQKAVAKAVKAHPAGSWVIGRGWDQEKLREARFPNRADLNEFSAHHVFLKRVCGHVGVANGLALSLAGIGRDAVDPYGGEIARDLATREPTGILKESAMELVERHVPRTEAETRRCLLTAARRLLRLGLTSLHCIVEDAMELKVLHKMKNEGAIPQSIYAIIPSSLLEYAAKLGLVADRGAGGFRFGGVKAYLDGSLGARTAALTEPYSDDPSSVGMLTKTYEQLDAVAEKASELDLQLCFHAIGDKAVEMGVETLERASRKPKGKGTRHRIEHASLAPAKLFHTMRRNGIVASVQPRFIFSDSWAGQRLGSQRVRSLYSFRSMLQSGVKVAAGSDCPAEHPNPFEGIWSAVTRPGLSPAERLTVPEALGCYTTGSAYASFDEKERGTLDPGMAADMVILDRDPYGCPPEDLRSIRVLKTILAGRLTN